MAYRGHIYIQERERLDADRAANRPVATTPTPSSSVAQPMQDTLLGSVRNKLSAPSTNVQLTEED